METALAARFRAVCGRPQDLGSEWKWTFTIRDKEIKNPSPPQVLLPSSKLIRKSHEYDNFSKWLADGLVTSKGPKWFARRKAITPAFHFQILENFIEIFDKNSAILVEHLSKYQPNDAVDLVPYVSLATLDVICGD